MLEPLCLSELGRLLEAGDPIPTAPAQGNLFPEEGGKR
jgi:hypothetical protein